MAISYSTTRSTSSARLKVAVAGISGVVLSLVAIWLGSWRVAPLIGWDVAALVFGAWTWATIWRMNAEVTSLHALREDPSRPAADGIVLVASLASLVAVGFVLATASNSHGTAKLLLIALGVASVVIGWCTVHTVFALQYAKMYYDHTPGGISFPRTPNPSYQDFAYIAFTIGMTFQVSDTGFETTEFRRLALRHSFLSYLFGTVIVATTINLIAGLTQ